MATSLADFEEISKECKGQKYLVKGAKGNMVQNPIYLMRSRIMKDSLGFASRFAITPSVRATMKIDSLEPSQESDIDDMFSDV